MFQRKCVAHLEAASLFPFAELVSCRVWLDEQTAGWGDAWHLDHLLVTHLPSNRAWRFDWRNWVPSPGGATMSAQVRKSVGKGGKVWKSGGVGGRGCAWWVGGCTACRAPQGRKDWSSRVCKGY